MTIVEFLLARIADDETRAREVEVEDPYTAERFRLFAECEAKRRIIDVHRIGVPVYGYCLICGTYCYSEDGCPGCMNPATSDTLNALAFVYRDHPDWREEWRP